jgi:hypothetical protein
MQALGGSRPVSSIWLRPPLNTSQPFLVVSQHLLNPSKDGGGSGLESPQSVGDFP